MGRHGLSALAAEVPATRRLDLSWCVAVAFAASLFACRHGTSLATGPTPPAARGADAGSAAPSRGTDDRSNVVFATAAGEAGTLLVPIACYDAATGRTRSAAECIDAVPPNAEVGIAGEATLEIVGRVPWPCSGEDEAAAPRVFSTTPASGQKAPAVSRWAIWPVTKAASVRTATAVSDGAPDLTIAVADLEAATKAAREAGGDASRPLRVTQALTAELDGDGLDEAIYAVTFRARTDEPSDEAWSGLLAKSGAARSSFSVLLHDTLASYEVLAVLDLDGDGRMELLVSSPYYEGEGVSLVHLAGGGVEVVGSWSCGL